MMGAGLCPLAWVRLDLVWIFYLFPSFPIFLYFSFLAIFVPFPPVFFLS